MYSVASSCKNVDENKLEQYFAAILFRPLLIILVRPVFNNIVAGWVFFCSVRLETIRLLQWLMKTGLNNVLLPTLFTVVNNIVTPDSGSTILFNIVD